MKKLILIITIGFLMGCSTQKNTLVNRTYHNVTAKFNYLFNAEQSFAESVKKYTKEYPFDYNSTLPIFLFSENAAPSKTSEGMDRAILKSGLLIKYHSMTTKPQNAKQNTPAQRAFYNQREFCKYVDDAYLILAKGNVYLHEYDKARLALDQIVLNYQEPEVKSEAQIWQGVVAGATGDMIQYQDALSSLSESQRLSGRNKTFLYAAYADYYIKKNEYGKAIEYLNLAIPLEKSRVTRSRYSFILGQLYQQTKNPAAAQPIFQKVARTAPSYEMAFNAKLEEARSFTTGNPNELKNVLLRMAKSEKNASYRDQIYFTIGKIYLADQNEKEAMEYFQKSLENSPAGSNQKGITFYTLANLAYSKKEFIRAAAIYDSAVTFLSSSHPTYLEAEKRAKKIGRLAKSMAEYNRLDSLIKLSLLSSDELNKLIDAKIAIINTQQLKVQEEQQRQQQFLMNQSNLSLGRPQSNSWYFYNQSTIAFGTAEFKMRWGQRKLEDNWRRKNKGTATEMEEKLAKEDSKEGQQKLSPLSREYYTADIPKKSEDRAAMEQRKLDALLEVAESYRADVDDPQAAISTCEQLLKQNPTADQELKAYTICYQSYLSLNEIDNTQKYKTLIVEKYPKSGIAYSLTNVGSYSSTNSEDQSNLQAAISHLDKGQYQECLAIASKYQDDTLSSIAPQFALLKALATGGLKGRDAYYQELTKIVKAYPSSNAARTAKEYIEQLDKSTLESLTSTSAAQQGASSPKGDKQATSAQKMQFDTTDGEHQLIIIVPQETNLNQLKFNLISFNLEAYPDMDFAISNQPLDSKNFMMIVKPFANKKLSMEYYYKLLEKQDIITQAGASSFVLFAITNTNLEMLVKEMAVQSYSDFFMEQYLK